jgi:hypothetical protein
MSQGKIRLTLVLALAAGLTGWAVTMALSGGAPVGPTPVNLEVGMIAEHTDYIGAITAVKGFSTHRYTGTVAMMTDHDGRTVYLITTDLGLSALFTAGLTSGNTVGVMALPYRTAPEIPGYDWHADSIVVRVETANLYNSRW